MSAYVVQTPVPLPQPILLGDTGRITLEDGRVVLVMCVGVRSCDEDPTQIEVHFVDAVIVGG